MGKKREGGEQKPLTIELVVECLEKVLSENLDVKEKQRIARRKEMKKFARNIARQVGAQYPGITERMAILDLARNILSIELFPFDHFADHRF